MHAEQHWVLVKDPGDDIEREVYELQKALRCDPVFVEYFRMRTHRFHDEERLRGDLLELHGFHEEPHGIMFSRIVKRNKMLGSFINWPDGFTTGGTQRSWVEDIASEAAERA